MTDNRMMVFDWEEQCVHNGVDPVVARANLEAIGWQTRPVNLYFGPQRPVRHEIEVFCDFHEEAQAKQAVNALIIQ